MSMPHDRPERRYAYLVTPPHDQVVISPPNRGNSIQDGPAPIHLLQRQPSWAGDVASAPILDDPGQPLGDVPDIPLTHTVDRLGAAQPVPVVAVLGGGAGADAAGGEPGEPVGLIVAVAPGRLQG